MALTSDLTAAYLFPLLVPDTLEPTHHNLPTNSFLEPLSDVSKCRVLVHYRELSRQRDAQEINQLIEATTFHPFFPKPQVPLLLLWSAFPITSS